MLRTGPVFLRAALLLIAPAAGCAKEGAHDFELARLFEAGRCTITAAGAGERPLPRAAMVEVAGEARPAVDLASGALLSCELKLPREPCWLDVEAARRDDDPVALSGAPLLLDVVLVAGGERTTLLHALPSPGTKPTAFGWVHSRIEIARRLGESVRLEFRFEPPPAAAAPASPPLFALADPRLSPRVDATAPPWSVVDWLAPGPDAGALAQPDAAKRWPGYARVAAATPAADVMPARRHRDDGVAASGLADPIELEVFGRERADDQGEVARRVCDRFALTEPLGPFTPGCDDPALRSLARLDLAVRADRARALGERTIECELARPRRAPLWIEITSWKPAAECDAALLRLQEFLAANGLLERTLLVVRTPPAAGLASGPFLAITRIPRGFRDLAPAALVERLDQLAFAVAGR